MSFATKQPCETIHIVADNESALQTLLDPGWCQSSRAGTHVGGSPKTLEDVSNSIGAPRTRESSGMT